MKHKAVSWEGALIGPETLDRPIDENAIKGRKPGDFGFKGKVRDEMLEAWAEAKAQWTLFSARREPLRHPLCPRGEDRLSTRPSPVHRRGNTRRLRLEDPRPP